METEIIDLMVKYGLKLMAAVIIPVIGFWVAGKITAAFKTVLEKREIEKSLAGFLTSLINIVLKILVVIIAVASVGVEMTSIAAMLGAASLAIGMALSGTLQNFAGGVVILFLKPFKVGDYIEAQNFQGTVKEIAIFTTLILTSDNKSIFIPNGSLANGSITNYTRNGTRRLEIFCDVAYGDDIEKARQVLMQIIYRDERIIRNPAPSITIADLNSSSVRLAIRVWTSSDDFFDVKFDFTEKMYNAIPENGLRFPFPQMDVHIIQ